jgi:hypothetical protein
MDLATSSRIKRRLVGIKSRIGTIDENIAATLSKKEVLEPIVSSAVRILDFLPASVPKSWEKPASPIVSKL